MTDTTDRELELRVNAALARADYNRLVKEVERRRYDMVRAQFQYDVAVGELRAAEVTLAEAEAAEAGAR